MDCTCHNRIVCCLHACPCRRSSVCSWSAARWISGLALSGSKSYVRAAVDRLYLGGVDPSIFDGGVTSIPGWECVPLDNGCPTGTAFLGPNGGYSGCTATGTPVTCSGTCTRCSGDTTAQGNLCKRNPTETCDLSPPTIPCGSKGAGNCNTVPPVDALGCGCTIPATYPGEECVFVGCLVFP